MAHATIAGTGSLMYFLHTNGVYAISENQLYPTDAFGNPLPLSLAIDSIFRETNYLPQNKYKLKRAVAFNYMKDNQYLLFLPCEDIQTPIRTANINSEFFALDSTTGAVIWTMDINSVASQDFPNIGNLVPSSAAIANKIVYVNSQDIVTGTII